MNAATASIDTAFPPSNSTGPLVNGDQICAGAGGCALRDFARQADTDASVTQHLHGVHGRGAGGEGGVVFASQGAGARKRETKCAQQERKHNKDNNPQHHHKWHMMTAPAAAGSRAKRDR